MSRLQVVLLCVGTAYAMTGQAQTEVAPDRGLEEIVVTAQRRAENLQSTPVAVSALTPETLDRLNIEDVRDIERAVPNLQIQEATANPSTLAASMRGSAETVGGLAVSEASVGVYVDDVYRGRPSGTNLEFTDIERIEVLRGPQGTLYGRNTIAGAIKVVSRKPADEFYAEATLGSGSRDKVVAKGAVGGPIGGGWAASLAALYRDEDGFQYNIARDRRVGDMSSVAGRAILNYYGDERFGATLTLMGGRDRNDGYNAVPATFDAPRTDTDGISFAAGAWNRTQTPAVNEGETDQASITLDTYYDFGGATLRSITGYVDIDDLFRTDFSGGVQAPGGGFAIGFFRDAEGQYEQFSEELQLTGESERLNWILGLYYFHENNRQVLSDLLGTLPLLPTDFRLRTHSYAVFGQGSFNLTDNLSLTAGLRWSQDKKKLNVSIQDGFAFPFTATTVRRDDEFDSLSPKIGIDWKRSDTMLLYASASRGFKAGGYNGIAIANPTVVDTPFDEMTVWSYEAGLKTEAFDRRLRFNAAAFLAEYDDIQQNALIDPVTFSFAIQNVGKATVYGLELEVQALPTDWLTVFAQLGLQHDSYDTLSPESTAAQNDAERLPMTSRTSGQVGFSIDKPLGTSLSLRLGSDLAYRGSYFEVVDNTLRIEPYWRWNGYIGLAFEDRWEARVSAQNITDDHTVICCSTLASGVTVLPPRTILAEVRYRL